MNPYNVVTYMAAADPLDLQRMSILGRDTLYLRQTVPASPLGSDEEAGVLKRPSESVESR